MSLKHFPLEYSGTLITVSVTLHGRSGSFVGKLALDTASNRTILTPPALLAIGHTYSPSSKKLSVTTGSGRDSAFEEYINGIEALGIAANRFNVVCKPLPLPLYFLDGLLGLDFFQKTKASICLDFEKANISTSKPS